MTDTPPPQAVDYSGLPLTEGDTVAFISTDPVALRQGRIRIIGPHNICIEDGSYLVLFDGAFAGWASRPPTPLGGTAVPSEEAKQVTAYPHVALQSAQPQPDFTSTIAGRVEVRQPCPHCADHQMIPRSQFDEHVSRLHPDVTR